MREMQYPKAGIFKQFPYFFDAQIIVFSI